jgi:histidinol-phosphate aminotransferase
VPLVGDDYAVDADALLATEACIIYLCSPNNPTATPVARDAVLRVVERAKGLVILDEAYAEFVAADPDARADDARAEVFTPEAPGWGRVLVLRTMSKAFGLAGLRVGYGVGHPAIVREVEKARGPFKVTYPAEKAVLAALGPGLPWVRARAADAVAQRERLQAGLRLAVGPDAVQRALLDALGTVLAERADHAEAAK